MSERKIGVELTADASGLQASLNAASASAQKFASSSDASFVRAAAAAARAGAGMDGLRESAQKLGLSEKGVIQARQDLIRSLELQALAVGRTKAELLELKAADLGVSSQTAPLINMLRQAETSMGGLGTSAAQTAHAMRMVPAQITDIVVSLQGGQAPMTVFLQQGGQLRDMFGGIVPAAKALGGAVAGMVNPFTLAAGAAVVLYAAHRQGQREMEEFNKAIIQTGGAAGATAGNLAEMARSIGEGSTTVGKASDVLAGIASSGKIARSAMEEIATAAIAMEQATGKSIQDTVSEFENLGKEPAKALAQLNDAYNFLTPSVYLHIRALEDQGLKEEAAAEAQRAYAKMVQDRANEVKASTDLMSRAWDAVAISAKKAWDAMVDSMRPDTEQDRIREIQAELDVIGDSPNHTERAARLRAQLIGLQDLVKWQNASAQSRADQAQKTRDLVAAEEQWGKILSGNLSKEQQMQKDIADIRKTGIALGKSELEIEQQIAAYRAKNSSKPSGGISASQNDIARLQAAIQAEEQRAQALAESGAEQSKLNDYERQALQYGEKIKLTTNAKTKAQLQHLQAMAETAGALKGANDLTEKDIRAIEQSTEKAREQTRALEDQAETYGLGKSAIEGLIIARLENRVATAEELNGHPGVIAALKEEIAARKELQGALSTMEAKDAQKKANDEFLREWDRVTQQVEQALTDAIFDGGKSGKELLQDLFKTLVVRVAIQPVVGAVSGTLQSMVGGLLGYSNQQQAGGLGMSSKSALSGMGIMGAGQAFAAAAPYLAGAAALAGVAYSAFSLGSKEVTGQGMAGWVKGSRGGQDVLTYETATRKGGWARGDSDYLDFSAGDAGMQSAIGQLVTETSQSLKAYADALNLNTKDIQEYAKHIFIPTMDRSAEEIQQNILSEVNLYAQELTRDFWPALQEVRRGGEELTDTLARVATAIQGVNPVLDTLGLKAFETSVQGGALASKLVDLFGGMEGFGTATSAYYDAFFTEQEKFDNGLKAMSARLGEIGVVLPDLSQSTDDVRKQYRAMIEAQDLSTEIGQRNAAILIQNSTAVLGLSEAATSLSEAAKAAEESVQDMTAILNERAGLERQIMQLMGDTEGLRRLDLAAIDESNRALQERIWALNDEAEAISKSVANQQAATALRNQADSLLGNIEAIREREIAGMDESVAAWQRYVWAIEDEQNRQAKAMEKYRIDLAEWQKLQDAVGEAFREVQRVASEEMAKLRDAARQTDDAMAALTQRVSAHTSMINDQVSGLETLLGTMRGVFDFLGDQIRDLRQEAGAGGMYAAQGRQLIGNAITTGIIPDADKLSQAVSAVRDEMSGKQYGSAFERDREAMILANQLEALQAQTEPQISLAEQQLQLAKDQLAQLEEVVRKAQAAIDETRGVKDNTSGLKISWDVFTESLAATLDQSASFDAVIAAIDAGGVLSAAAWDTQISQWETMISAASQQNAALQALVDAGLIADANSKSQIAGIGSLLDAAKTQVAGLRAIDMGTAQGVSTARSQVDRLRDLMAQAQSDAVVLDAIAGNGASLLAAWDSLTASMVDVLDQSDSFAAIIAAIESGTGVTESAWLAQIGKWDASLDAAQKQYTALQSLVDAGLVTDAGTQAQIDVLGALLSEAQKQVGVLEGVDTNTGASGTAGEQVKKLQDLFDEATKQIQALSSVESTTSWTKDLYDKVLSATTYEQWATKEIEGINKQLDLAQKQLDAFNGVSAKATTMIQALNNMAAALSAAQVAQPNNPGAGGGAQVELPPKLQVPETVMTASHGFTDAEVRGKRHYSPVTESEAYDYIFGQEQNMQDEWKKAWQSGTYHNTAQGMLYWARAHWREYGQFDGGGTRRYAKGGYYPGGMALVGEEGPELINFARPGQVYTASETQDILGRLMRPVANGGGMTESLIEEVKALRKEVSMLRYEARASAQNTSKISSLLDDVTQDGQALRTKAA
ncbi:MAG: phage tail length tape measure family protein [Pigmentiphaga sp.]